MGMCGEIKVSVLDKFEMLIGNWYLSLELRGVVRTENINEVGFSSIELIFRAHVCVKSPRESVDRKEKKA